MKIHFPVKVKNCPRHLSLNKVEIHIAIRTLIILQHCLLMLPKYLPELLRNADCAKDFLGAKSICHKASPETGRPHSGLHTDFPLTSE